MSTQTGQVQESASCGERLGERLVAAGLRATRQRLALAQLLFGKGDRHISAEILFDEAREAGVPISLATVYNTLHQFSAAGLLRAIAVDTARTYFDTNTGNHQHYFLEETNQVVDIPESGMEVANLPQPPLGYEISRIDVVVRLKRAR